VTSADFHQILVPYLWAIAATVAVLGVTAGLLRRDGDKHKAEEAAEREAESSQPARSTGPNKPLERRPRGEGA
jgi:hypothetical protein